ncbi:hypothetical protein [Thermosporothrix hazakensis]|nr:hypothetical protein [Thermosporothrix hazakensis]
MQPIYEAPCQVPPSSWPVPPSGVGPRQLPGAMPQSQVPSFVSRPGIIPRSIPMSAIPSSQYIPVSIPGTQARSGVIVKPREQQEGRRALLLLIVLVLVLLSAIIGGSFLLFSDPIGGMLPGLGGRKQMDVSATVVSLETYPFSTSLKLNDPLQDASQGNGWVSNEHCRFEQGAYLVSAAAGGFYTTCPATATNFSNCTYEVTFSLVKGEAAGLTFRGDETGERYYTFLLNREGNFALLLYNGVGQSAQILAIGKASPFRMGSENRLAVAMLRNEIKLLVNEQPVTVVTDQTLQSGQIGLIVYGKDEEALASFKHARVWLL